MGILDTTGTPLLDELRKAQIEKEVAAMAIQKTDPLTLQRLGGNILNMTSQNSPSRLQQAVNPEVGLGNISINKTFQNQPSSAPQVMQPSKLAQVIQPVQQPKGQSKLGTFLTSVGHGMLGMPVNAQYTNEQGKDASWINYLGANIGNEIKDMRVTENGVPVKTTTPTFFNDAADRLKQNQALEAKKGTYETSQRQAALLGIPPTVYMNPDGTINENKLYTSIADKGQAGTAREKRIAKQQEFANEYKLRDEFNKSQVKKDFDILSRSFGTVSKAFETSTNKDTKSRIASDQAMGVMIQKMLDPQSVVRESEYARTPEGASLINRISAVLPQLEKGGLALTDSDRKAILDMAGQLYNAGGELYQGHVDRYKGLALDYGFDPKKTLGKIHEFKPYAVNQGKDTSNIDSVANKFGF